MNKDEQQSISIARLEEKFGAFQKNMIDRLDKFDDKLDNMLGSFNQDKVIAKNYIDEKFVTKTEIAPLMRLFRSANDFSVKLVVAVGIIGIGIIVVLGDFIRSKLNIQ